MQRWGPLLTHYQILSTTTGINTHFFGAVVAVLEVNDDYDGNDKASCVSWFVVIAMAAIFILLCRPFWKELYFLSSTWPRKIYGRCQRFLTDYIDYYQFIGLFRYVNPKNTWTKWCSPITSLPLHLLPLLQNLKFETEDQGPYVFRSRILEYVTCYDVHSNPTTNGTSNL